MNKILILINILFLQYFVVFAQSVPEYNVKIDNFSLTENHSNAYYKGILLQFDYDLFCRQQGKNVQLTIIPKLIDEKKSELLLPQNAILKENITEKQFFNKHYIRKKAEIFIPYVSLKKYFQTRIIELQLHYQIAERIAIKTFSQEVNFRILAVKAIKPTAQEIQVENFIANNYYHPAQKVNGLQVKFKCNFKYAFDEIMGSDTNGKNATCIVVPKLFIKNQCVFPVSVKQEIQQELLPLRNISKPEINSKSVEFFIPHHQINGDGVFKASLVLEFYDAKKSFQFPVNFKREVEIAKSAGIQYQNQEFTVKKLSVTDNMIYDSQHGMFVNIEVIPKYTINQISGADTNADLQNYYFYAELFNEQKQKVFPDVQLTPLSVTALRKSLRPLSKAMPYKLQLFIPYRCINVAEGLQSLRLKLNAENNNKSITFSNIAQQTITFRQPQRFIMRIEVNNLTVPEGNYDVSAQNIPIINLFIGKKSTAGKGKADLFWTIAAGTERLFASGVAKNSLKAFDGATQIILTDKDIIKLKVFDQDILSFHDFIGEIDIAHKNGEDAHTLDAITAKGITNLNLQFKKNVLPSLKNYRLEMQNPFVYGGASGIAIDFEYALNALSEDEIIVIKPLLLKDSNVNMFNDFYVLEQTLGNTELAINSEHPAGHLKLFIPYWKLIDGCQFGLQLYNKNHDFILANFVLPDIIFVPKINDVGAVLKVNADAIEDDFTGLKIITENSVPTHYLTDKGLQQVTFVWSLTIKSGNAEKNNLVINDIATLKTSFHPDAPQFAKSVFVPYYLIKNLRGQQELIFKQTARVTGTNFVIGEHTENIIVNFPELLQVQVQEVKLQLQKMKKTKKLYFEIYHGKNMMYHSDTLKNSKEIIWNTMKSNTIVLHPNDVVSVYLFGKDKRNRETLSYIWAYKGKDFYRIENNFSLSSTAFLKNGKISFFTTKK